MREQLWTIGAVAATALLVLTENVAFAIVAFCLLVAALATTIKEKKRR